MDKACSGIRLVSCDRPVNRSSHSRNTRSLWLKNSSGLRHVSSRCSAAMGGMTRNSMRKTRSSSCRSRIETGCAWSHVARCAATSLIIRLACACSGVSWTDRTELAPLTRLFTTRISSDE
jgi:hypothetical protein